MMRVRGGKGEENRGTDGGAGKERIVFSVDTGHRGEPGREGIWTT